MAAEAGPPARWRSSTSAAGPPQRLRGAGGRSSATAARRAVAAPIDHYGIAVDSLDHAGGRSRAASWPPGPRSARSNGSAPAGRCSSATSTAWSSRCARPGRRRRRVTRPGEVAAYPEAAPSPRRRAAPGSSSPSPRAALIPARPVGAQGAADEPAAGDRPPGIAADDGRAATGAGGRQWLTRSRPAATSPPCPTSCSSGTLVETGTPAGRAAGDAVRDGRASASTRPAPATSAASRTTASSTSATASTPRTSSAATSTSSAPASIRPPACWPRRSASRSRTSAATTSSRPPSATSRCPTVNDPIRTTHVDGTPVDASVVAPFLASCGRLLRAILLPLGVAFAIIFVLVSIRWLITGIVQGRRLRRAHGERAPRGAGGDAQPAQREPRTSRTPAALTGQGAAAPAATSARRRPSRRG